MFYFLMASFITFWDLFFIKTGLSRGRPYPASIGSSFRNALFSAFDSYFALFAISRINNKQFLFNTIILFICKHLSEGKLNGKVATHLQDSVGGNSVRYKMIKLALVTHYIIKVIYILFLSY
jgi:hypothetical protein